MTTRRRGEHSRVAEVLDGLLAAGDHRSARARAAAVLADPGATPADRAAAEAALARLGPERGAALAAAAGLIFLVVVALAGLARGP